MLCSGNAFHKHYMDSDLYFSHVYPWRDLSGYLSCWMCCYKCHIYTPEYWCSRLSYKLSCVWWKRFYRHILCCTSYKQIAWFCVAQLRALCSEPFPQRFSDKGVGVIRSIFGPNLKFLYICHNIAMQSHLLLSSSSPKQQSHTSSPLTLSHIPFFILCFSSIYTY